MKLGKIKQYIIMYILGFLNLPYLNRLSKKSPIIIGGCGRSGTTLLLSILAAHPKLHGIDIETGLYSYATLRTRTRFKTQILTAFYLCKGKKNSAERWIEKTPKNITNVDLINAYFNNKVQIINIIRDGRDVVTSIHPTKKSKYWVTIDRWINDVTAGIESEKYDNVFTIKYEDIISDFKSSITKILNFLGEDYVTELKDYDKYTNVKNNRAWDSKVQKIFSKSVNKWQNGEHKERMEEFYKNKTAVELLKYLGYK